MYIILWVLFTLLYWFYDSPTTPTDWTLTILGSAVAAVLVGGAFTFLFGGLFEKR